MIVNRPSMSGVNHAVDVNVSCVLWQW